RGDDEHHPSRYLFHDTPPIERHPLLEDSSPISYRKPPALAPRRVGITDNDNSTMAAKTISVLVKPGQAELGALGTQVGTVQLVMRNAVDDEAESTGGADLQKLLTGRSDTDDGPPGDPHSFITSLKPKPPEPPAPPPVVAPEPPDDVFVMTIIDGSVPREVEFRRGKLVTPSTAAPPPSAVEEPPAASDSPPPGTGGQQPAETEKQARTTGRRMR
ncbi:MAG TPA: hypothetical protein PK867_18535, partial [Pirellulales bacterium]|nr:hypothetical protein [Pirellulales bacterium]